jgi:hypothetical protein
VKVPVVTDPELHDTYADTDHVPEPGCNVVVQLPVPPLTVTVLLADAVAFPGDVAEIVTAAVAASLVTVTVAVIAPPPPDAASDADTW